MAPLVSFLLISIIWGTTWVAIKVGVGSIPPLFFGGTRFVAAGLALGLLFRNKIDWRPLRAEKVKLVVVSALMTTLCFGPIFWGMRSIPSSIAAVINLGLLPVGLLVIGTMLRIERPSFRKLAGIGLGVVGLIIIFASDSDTGELGSVVGMAAVAAGTLASCGGSVLARHWLGSLETIGVSSAVCFLGGIGLLALSATSESWSQIGWAALLQPATLSSWLFLVIPGSVVAMTLYLQIINAWGPVRAGLFAFVSPIIAPIAGFLILGERLEAQQLVAACVLIAAAALCSEVDNRPSSKQAATT